ncbi:TonB-dependent receptor [candidate division KSB1 bacterium]|nr:TonB-dependent receptor [candidate division KSB1 bacterium]
MKCKYILFIVLFSFTTLVHAGQTGKVTGVVLDGDTGTPLMAVNVIIEGTSFGAATDMDGYYAILNVPPGSYTIFASMIGYRTTRFTDVKVSVDRTTNVDFKLAQSVVDLGDEITVIAERPLIQKDLTATASSVSADEITAMPVESFQDILKLQAGIVKDSGGDLHIRGGRASEIAYMVDGVSVSDPFSGKLAVEVDQGAIQELKVISGTFNAEYGQVMSGIVEIVTKDPDQEFKIGASFYAGDYLSDHRDLFLHIDDISPLSLNNAQIYMTGPSPIFSKKLSYYISMRRLYNEGWLYGQRRYNPSDSSNFVNSNAVYSEQSGDDAYVPMNESVQYYANAKLVLAVAPGIKLSYNFLGDISRWKYYDHLYKYNPDGNVKNRDQAHTHILNWNHTLSSRTFYTFKLNRYHYDYKSYLYENLYDPNYVNPELLRNREDAYRFLTGGTNMTHFYRTTTVNQVKFDITSQATRIHQLKAGTEFKYNELHLENRTAYYKGVEGGGIYSAERFFNAGEYTHHPFEAVAYIQDKIELTWMTLNAGLRYDYFNANQDVPVDLRDPDNSYSRKEQGFAKAKPKHQISPRIGIAFPISATGVVHVSYGHFFQLPPYEYLYMNPRFAVAPGGLSTLMGNADLDPQTTVIYEVGYQQSLLDQIGIDVTGFYKDARNLLGTEIYETYILGDRYARYINRDYGNIRGITVALNKRATASDHLTVSFDYTYQVAEGNASDPNHQFYNNQADPPKKSNIQVVPLNWDQRHTLNLSASFDNPRFIGVGVIGQFQSGLPYTPAIQSQETTFENSGRKPFNSNVDFRFFKHFQLGHGSYTAFVKVYNLFDRTNEINVYDDTGRAGYSLVSQYVGERRAHVNSLAEWLRRPDFYSEPRKILIGLDVEF